MSKEFIESGLNSNIIRKAALQEDQLAYFTMSDMQSNNLTDEYLSQWANRKYQGNDYFLNYVKSVFKTQNFLTFFKYLRKPLPSAKIINNKIVPQLKKIFNAENAEFKYNVSGVDEIDLIELLDINNFEHELFGRMLFRHNSLIVSDIYENKPYRYFVDIKNVISIDGKHDVSKIAFTGAIERNGKEIEGYVYIDAKVYAFYDKDKNLIEEINHNLKRCPVHFISPKEIGRNWVLRESIFSYIREELEEYTFLKTLQKMTDPNGALPIITMIDADILNDKSDISGEDMEQDISNAMASQRADIYSNNPINEGIMQTGSVFKIPPIEKDGGGLDMDVIKNFVNFHYIPTEALNYLNNRIKEIEHSIVYTIVGGMIDGVKEGSKNELQIEESLSVLQNTLIYFSESFNKIRKVSDEDMLRLVYGDRVNEVFIFYGTDFFLDTESMLYKNLERATNTIERKNILLRINQNRYNGNNNKLSRQKILYDLIPYISDDEFKLAIDAGKVDDITFKYQTQFNYWISQFEAKYGDLVIFYMNLNVEKAEKLTLINNLIVLIINNHKIIEK